MLIDYTAIGDHVSIAARVEKLTREYHAKIIITEFTVSHIEGLINSGSLGHVALNFADTVKVKGREKGLQIYEIKDSKEKETL